MCEPISPALLEDHLRTLVREIGVRLAGSESESRAASYIADAFRQCGAEVSIEAFPIRERAVESERLEIRIGAGWEAFPGSLFSNTPGTDGQSVEAPLVFFESPAEVMRTDLSRLAGCAVVHLGCHIESREAYRRLIQAQPAFLLMVDIRYPGAVPLADGMFPAYTSALGAVPTMNVAYLDAWRWKTHGATAARLVVKGGMREGRSQNVIAELPGTEPDGEILFAGAHHDTQADSPGADDNAGGVAGLLELARTLAPLPRKRTFRLISFGCEEQLSVGSATYVRAHREALARRARFMFNLDSYGSPLGWTDAICNGPPELARHLRDHFDSREVSFRLAEQVMPYADHFPFVAAGIPSLTLTRSNCTAGRFFHHRPDDDMDKVCPATLATLLNGTASFLARLGAADVLPFPCAIPVSLQCKVAEFWEDLFGGWGHACP